jgi:asparagine N-glycosylation enzyme membrane subunit Stt3
MDMPKELPAAIAAILGALSPIFIALIKEKVKNQKYHFWIAVLFSMIVGLVANLVAGEPISNAPESVAMAFTFATIAWQKYWKNLWLEKKADK